MNQPLFGRPRSVSGRGQESLPVFVSWTRGVNDWEAQVVVSGMRDMLKFTSLAPEIKIFGQAAYLPASEPYSSPDWYQENNLIQLPGRPAQVDANGIANDLCNEPWRRSEPHIDLMVFDRDFNCQIDGKWINFIFGMASPLLGSIQSIYRFRQGIEDYATYRLVLREIGQHEFGHVLGLVSREGRDRRDGLYRNHCTNSLCVMRQVMSVSEAVESTLARLEANAILCQECQEELSGY